MQHSHHTSWGKEKKKLEKTVSSEYYCYTVNSGESECLLLTWRAEIIVSCDLLGICQLDEIITQSCSRTLP